MSIQISITGVPSMTIVVNARYAGNGALANCEPKAVLRSESFMSERIEAMSITAPKEQNHRKKPMAPTKIDSGSVASSLRPSSESAMAVSYTHLTLPTKA